MNIKHIILVYKTEHKLIYYKLKYNLKNDIILN